MHFFVFSAYYLTSGTGNLIACINYPRNSNLLPHLLHYMHKVVNRDLSRYSELLYGIVEVDKQQQVQIVLLASTAIRLSLKLPHPPFPSFNTNASLLFTASHS